MITTISLLFFLFAHLILSPAPTFAGQSHSRLPANGAAGGETFFGRGKSHFQATDSRPLPRPFTGHAAERLSFSYHSESPEERGNLDRTIIRNGKPLVASKEATAKLDYSMYDFVYQYDLLGLEDFLSGISLGAVGQVILMDGELAVQSGSKRLREDFTASLPMLGLDFHIDILNNLLEGRIRATGMGYHRGRAFDGRAEVALSPAPYLDIYGGYKLFFIDVENEDLNLDYQSSGPYMGISLSF